MSLLGAVTIDFAEQLKRATKGWVITPLVVWEENLPIEHNCLLFVKRPPQNHSPEAFYTANPPVNSWAFLQIKQRNRPLRLVGLEIVADVKLSVHLTFWRANGYVQHDVAMLRSFHRYRRHNGGVEGYEALLVYQIHHVGPRANKGKRAFYKHSFDLTVPQPPVEMAELVVKIIDKSYEWYGRGRQETFGHYEAPLMVNLNGTNYNASRHYVY